MVSLISVGTCVLKNQAPDLTQELKAACPIVWKDSLTHRTLLSIVWKKLSSQPLNWIETELTNGEI